jgi:pimeloyl-ACP methyl ester carboxylesterase
MTERIVQAQGVDIWTEDFGDPSAPTLLLVMGAAQQAIVRPDALINALVAGGKHVIRYDNRDVGQTTCMDFQKHPYTVADMAADAVAVLDAYSVDQANLVGTSMGGMIVQMVALNAPERVRTMTSIMSTPLARGYLGVGKTGLPSPDQKVLDVVAANTQPPASDDERIDRAVQLRRTLAGTMAPFDADEMRELERRILARANNIDAANNHMLAVASSPDRTDDLARITNPHPRHPRNRRPDHALRPRRRDRRGHPRCQAVTNRRPRARTAGAGNPDPGQRHPRPYGLKRSIAGKARRDQASVCHEPGRSPWRFANVSTRRGPRPEQRAPAAARTGSTRKRCLQSSRGPE